MPTYTPIQSIELTSATSFVSFSNIPQTYEDLVLIVSDVIHSFAGTTTVRDGFLQFNGDTGSNYSDTIILGNGSSPSSVRASNQSALRAYYPMASAANAGMIVANIQNYSNSTKNKTVLYKCSVTTGNTSAMVGLWRNTSPINSLQINLSYTLSAGTKIDLYGISPVGANNTQAFGGTEIYYDSSFTYHVYKSSGTFTPNINLTADILVVGGGGGGGGYSGRGGGGGAGGLLGFTNQSLTANTSYTVTVGAGGYGGISASTNATSGSNSQFGSLTTVIGGGRGGGAGSNDYNAATGGSGGGGRASGGTGAAGTAGQGTTGGNADGGGYGAGGGGGASVAGGNGSGNNAGTGGNGSSAYSSWGLATNTGHNSGGIVYYAGGGSGGFTGSGAAAGLGGGGAGGSATGTAATTNTGGGGGGANNGANGGSGIVIVRYAR